MTPLIKKLFVDEGAGTGLVDRTVRIAVLVPFSPRPSSAPTPPSRSSPGPDTGSPPRRYAEEVIGPLLEESLHFTAHSTSVPPDSERRRSRTGGGIS
ncbi:hypothetical protein PV726_05505 [Streptomyces europaeiscabiei]|uniref:hypothetical protein n=1 Tax=Streptomyces europaeiscabiei TaxID=146819 RepID=UPI0029BB1DEF|nr:hypothetical protein [Streptomyces europaeiscabiei]MDX3689801.1 hypothetical protein [Streptomyces europaeiscabiei]